MVMFPDPVVEVITYLTDHYPGTNLSQDPRPHDHDGLYVQVVDTGGGPFEQVMDDARITVETSHEDSVIAADAARLADALLRAYRSPIGRWLSTVARPRYSPDPDVRVPAYELTHTLRFRGEEVTVP